MLPAILKNSRPILTRIKNGDIINIYYEGYNPQAGVPCLRIITFFVCNCTAGGAYIVRGGVLVDTYIYLPKGDAKKAELAKRVSAMHAAYVLDYVAKLSCSSEQKIELIDEIIKTKDTKGDYNGQP